MARKPKAPPQLTQEEIDQAEADRLAELTGELSPEEKKAVEEAEKLTQFQQLHAGERFQIAVFRYNKEEADYELLGRYPLDTFDTFGVLRPFGKGKYRMTLLNQTSQFVKGGTFYVLMGDVPQPPAPPAAAAATPDPMQSPAVQLLIENLKANSVMLAEIVKAALTRPESTNAKVPSLGELAATLKDLKTLGAGDESGAKKMRETLELLDLAQRITGKGEGGGEDKSLLREIIEGLKDAKDLGILPGARKPAPAALPAPVQTARVVVNPEPPEPAPVPESPIIAGLRPYIAVFAQKARAQVPIEDSANFLYDELYTTVLPLLKANLLQAKYASDDMILDNLINRARDPEQVQEIFNFAPELIPYRAYIEGVISRAVFLLETPEPAAQA